MEMRKPFGGSFMFECKCKGDSPCELRATCSALGLSGHGHIFSTLPCWTKQACRKGGGYLRCRRHHEELGRKNSCGWLPNSYRPSSPKLVLLFLAFVQRFGMNFLYFFKNNFTPSLKISPEEKMHNGMFADMYILTLKLKFISTI